MDFMVVWQWFGTVRLCPCGYIICRTCIYDGPRPAHSSPILAGEGIQELRTWVPLQVSPNIRTCKFQSFIIASLHQILRLSPSPQQQILQGKPKKFRDRGLKMDPTHQNKPTLGESGAGNCEEHVGTSHCPRFSSLRVSSGTLKFGNWREQTF